jgi:hypothetical protein
MAYFCSDCKHAKKVISQEPCCNCRGIFGDEKRTKWEPKLPPKLEVNAQEIITNEQGGKQSKLDHEWLDFDPSVMLRLAEISARGKAKYGERNWENISTADHINHAITHVYKHLAGDKTEDHLANATCRLIFALATGDAVGEDLQGEVAQLREKLRKAHEMLAAEGSDAK